MGKEAQITHKGGVSGILWLLCIPCQAKKGTMISRRAACHLFLLDLTQLESKPARVMLLAHPGGRCSGVNILAFRQFARACVSDGCRWPQCFKEDHNVR